MNDDIYNALERRIGRIHLRQRLGIETDYEARVFGQGINFFHIENWYSVHGLIRGTLRALGLHGRGRRNALKLGVTNNRVTLPRLPRAFDGFRILQISDPHLDMNDKIPHALIERVRDLTYDLCVLTGDFRARTYGAFQPAVEAMQRVRVHLKGPVYGILGNHDTIRMVPGFEAAGIRMLLNETVRIERGDAVIYVAGVDDAHYYRVANIEKAAHAVPPEALSILLSHTPEIYRHAAHAEFDLMLSGHTHGGQICLPGGTPLMCNARCPRHLCAGPWRYHDMQGYTSRGSGVSIVDVRFNCPAEITVHELRRADQ
jgi:hypothetical protein